ncbi:MAG TPA: haloacid dehalogenase-like hydrolase [Streptosporangiaceae bacterium]|nr:haloacid dehalogenase-like hydrolase [Streptosporangiaceae bacterium]
MRYGRVVRGRLVLWDVDHTLLDAGGAGVALLRQAFTELFGCPFPATPPMAGRTDRAIELEILTRAGLADPAAQLPAFQRLAAGLAPEFGELVRSGGRVLPGAAEALAAVAALADGSTGPVQSVLTGNLRAIARVKLAALGLDRFLDLQVGAYGDDHEVRADLVPLARASAAAAYRADFGGDATVLIGDTPLDVEAARLTGARSVGVASGGFTVAELAAAGADVVLPSLADTPAVLAALLPG